MEQTAPIASQTVPQYSAVVDTPAAPATGAQAAAPASGGGMFDFIKSWNLIEVVLTISGTVAIWSIILAQRYKLKEEKTAWYDVQRRLDKQDQRMIGHELDLSRIADVLQGAA